MYWMVPANRTSGLKGTALQTRTNTTKFGAASTSGGSSSSTTLYGKKERATNSRKKGKSVLCDAQQAAVLGFQKKKETATTTATTNVPLLNLVPVKRLKGSEIMDDLSAGPSTSSSSIYEDNIRTPATNMSSQTEEASTSGSGITKVTSRRTSGIPIFKRPVAVTIATTLSGISALSYTSPSTSKASSLIGPGQSSVNSSSARGIANKKSVGTEATTASIIGGGGSSGMVKLKNKRSLKSDAATIKRKKSRAKSVWH